MFLPCHTSWVGSVETFTPRAITRAHTTVTKIFMVIMSRGVISAAPRLPVKV